MNRTLFLIFLGNALTITAWAGEPVSSMPVVGGPASMASNLSRLAFRHFGADTSYTNMERNAAAWYIPVPSSESSYAFQWERAEMEKGEKGDTYTFVPSYDYSRFQEFGASGILPVSYGKADPGNSSVYQVSTVLGATFHLADTKYNPSWDWVIIPSVHFGYTDDNRLEKMTGIAGGAITSRAAYNFFYATVGFSTQIWESFNLRKDSPGNDQLMWSNELDIAMPLARHWILTARGGYEYSFRTESVSGVWHWGIGATFRDHPTKTSLTKWMPSQLSLDFDNRIGGRDYTAYALTASVAWLF